MQVGPTAVLIRHLRPLLIAGVLFKDSNRVEAGHSALRYTQHSTQQASPRVHLIASVLVSTTGES